jgi:uncharacterized protein (DUF1697 family)
MRYAAFLRGINVGKAKRVTMADLRALVEALGYRDVRTLLNSGNIVFTGARAAPERVASRIEGALVERTGVSARVMVLTAEMLAAAIRENPFADVADDPARLLVAVLAGADARSRLAPLLERDWAPDALALGGHAAYLWCPSGILESPVLTAVGRALGDGVTTRNWTTMTKLHALLA